MTDKKISELDALTTLATDDLFVVVDDVAGTPTTKKITAANVRNLGLAGGAARPLLTGGARLSGSGLVLTGLASNFASSPDSAALDITGDIDIKVKVAMTDWTPAAQAFILAKYNTTGNQRSWYLSVDTGGTVSLANSSDGTAGALVSGTSTVATGFTDGATKWIRATLDVNNGASQRVYKFYTSDDGTTWTQLGTTVTTAGATSIFNSTTVLETGSFNVGAAGNISATVYRVIIQSAFDTANNTASLAYDADFETATADALAFTETANSATVTINTTRYSYGFPDVQFSFHSTIALNAGRTNFNVFRVVAPVVVDMAYFEVTSAPAST